MWTYLGKVIKQGRAWTDAEGVQHPAQWNRWTDEEKAAKGLVWNQDLQPVPFDNRFYWSADVPKALDDVDAVDEDGNPVLDEDGVQIVTKGLKSNAIAQVKATAAGLLQPTDWMVIKASEVADYSVDQATLDYRASVRTASNTIEAAITAAADHAAFMALYDVPVDADGIATGNAPINDWPQEI
jgi:hypothetical protein